MKNENDLLTILSFVYLFCHAQNYGAPNKLLVSISFCYLYYNR